MFKTITPALLLLLILCFAAEVAMAGSATWNVNPTTGDWNTAGNWTPATVPNGPSDIATFATSTRTSISLSTDSEGSEIDFGSGASAYTITGPSVTVDNFAVSGAGIVNNPGSGKILWPIQIITKL